MRAVMLTTTDNPFDPYDDFDSWLLYDCQKGYNTCGLIARITHTSNALSDVENAREVERAIDEIIYYDPLNIYKKLVREVDE